MKRLALICLFVAGCMYGPVDVANCVELCRKASPLFEVDATEVSKDAGGPVYCSCRVRIETLTQWKRGETYQ